MTETEAELHRIVSSLPKERQESLLMRMEYVVWSYEEIEIVPEIVPEKISSLLYG